MTTNPNTETIKDFKTLLREVKLKAKNAGIFDRLFLCHLVEHNSELYSKGFSRILAKELEKIPTTYKELFENTRYYKVYKSQLTYNKFLKVGSTGVWEHNDLKGRVAFIKAVITNLQNQKENGSK